MEFLCHFSIRFPHKSTSNFEDISVKVISANTVQRQSLPFDPFRFHKWTLIYSLCGFWMVDQEQMYFSQLQN